MFWPLSNLAYFDGYIRNFFLCLTHQQVKAEKKLLYILPATEDTWKALKKLRGIYDTILDDCEFYFFEMDDAKFLHILTQHSLWNRLFQPFLLYKCQRGEGVWSADHKCKRLSDGIYKRYWDCLGTKFEKEKGKNLSYTVAKHKDWCDKHNFGITHFGVHPDNLPLSSIRFDTFHCTKLIAVTFMHQIRFKVRKYSANITQALNVLLERIFSIDFALNIWNSKRSFNIFDGKNRRRICRKLSQICRVFRE